MLSFFFPFFFISIFGHAIAKGTCNCYFELSCYIFQCILIFRVFECVNKRMACAMQVNSPKRQLPPKSGGWSKSLVVKKTKNGVRQTRNVRTKIDIVKRSFVSKETGIPATGPGEMDEVTAMRDWCSCNAAHEEINNRKASW